MDTWNKRISYALTARGLKAASLARACKIAPSSVQEWLDGETRNITAVNAVKACGFLRIRIEWLILGHGVSGLDEIDSERKSPDGLSFNQVVQLRKHPRESSGIRTRIHARVDQLSDVWLQELDKRLDQIDELIADARKKDDSAGSK